MKLINYFDAFDIKIESLPSTFTVFYDNYGIILDVVMDHIRQGCLGHRFISHLGTILTDNTYELVINDHYDGYSIYEYRPFSGFMAADPSNSVPITRWGAGNNKLLQTDIIQSQYLTETYEAFKLRKLHPSDSKPIFQEYESTGKYGHTYGTQTGAIVSFLDIIRAWVHAGNTAYTSHYAIMTVGGEAEKDPGNGFGTVLSKRKLDTAGTYVNSGVLQCDACRDNIEYFNGITIPTITNNNLVEHIWATTRAVILNRCGDFLNIKGLQSTYENENNWIGPICHMASDGGVAWSSVNNFPNNYNNGFLSSLSHGAYLSTSGCKSAWFGQYGKGLECSIRTPQDITIDSNCNYKESHRDLETIAWRIKQCALAVEDTGNYKYTNVIDCPKLEPNVITNYVISKNGTYISKELCTTLKFEGTNTFISPTKAGSLTFLLEMCYWAGDDEDCVS